MFPEKAMLFRINKTQKENKIVIIVWVICSHFHCSLLPTPQGMTFIQ
jgi:hypothetical protein